LVSECHCKWLQFTAVGWQVIQGSSAMPQYESSLRLISEVCASVEQADGRLVVEQPLREKLTATAASGHLLEGAEAGPALPALSSFSDGSVEQTAELRPQPEQREISSSDSRPSFSQHRRLHPSLPRPLAPQPEVMAAG
jgi:hypothetical protein